MLYEVITLSFEVLFLPPLRNRREDILLLARHFAGRMARETGREEAPVFSPRAEASLLEHPWPGNIRELNRITSYNVCYTKYYANRKTFQETAHMRDTVFHNPEDWDSLMEKTRSGRRLQNRTVRLKNREGETVWCLLNLTPVIQEGTVQAEGFLENITA